MDGRLRFILPFGAILFVFVLYSAYWFYASTQIRAAVEDWVADQEAAGYVIEREALTVSGYPYRFQITFREPNITAPASDGGWHAELASLQAHAVPYDLSHWIVRFGGPAFLDDLNAPGSRLELDASDARVSLVYDDAGETTRVGADLVDLTVVTRAGDAPDIRSIGALYLNGVVATDNTLRVRGMAENVIAAPGVLDPDVERAFGETLAMARLEFTVTEWSSLARNADAMAWSQAGGRLDITDAGLQWGPADLTAVGEFTVDRMARPDGRLSLRVTDPDTLAEALVEAGLIPEQNREALRVAAMMAPRGPEGVSLPFRIRDGGVYLGPARLGGLED
ncbi:MULTISPECIES: DUF2125 domain-containing protein [Maricaulis]|jgi:hypothetical protein|uniref:DUF2125 domain-containing protein n=1 Tax=Maricaulis maris (strain MCS10) TaxID=394221 RepID=Q0AM23_MARMM|nr:MULTISPECIES: DUF2125 domain-containing protein [Maricaulis]ABI66670.1 conserved hypothetical protein [Maricaulis maris MCS10]MAC88593.1 DUF2125 domain-containing protein [Maricaulis sp.]